jgi:L-seryl-tRNA(Ser) seleniumtransferase
MPTSRSALAALPAVDRLLRQPRVAALPRPLALRAVRAVIDELRARVLAEGAEVPPVEELIAAVEVRVAGWRQPGIRTVLNATGVVLHTNLGRAPLAEAAQQAVAVAARGYGTVEIDLESGQRGDRLTALRARLAHLVGAEDAVVVNNNAAATLLTLTALAQGRSVVVSRGELVEIGGSFRIPEVAEAGGARLIEVGATNRTRVADYVRALDALAEPAAGLLRVHRSNFRIVGFTELPERAELAALAHARGLWLYEDLGSGNLLPETPEEPTVSQVLAEGVDLVSFSGDKLLGGPQAGIVVGRADLIQRLRHHPLYRALRLDKLVLAALDATLALVQEGREAEIPTVGMLRLGPQDLWPRCEALRAAVGRPDLDLTIEPVDGRAGAGALPELPLASVALVVRGLPVADLAQALRHADPPVLARQSQDALLLDPRALLPEQDRSLAAVLRRILDALSPSPTSAADPP